MMRLHFWTSEERGILFLLTLLSDTLKPEVVIPFRVPSWDQIDFFKNYSRSIGPCAKKLLKKRLYKKMKLWTHNERSSVSSRHKITQVRLTCYQSINHDASQTYGHMSNSCEAIFFKKGHLVRVWLLAYSSDRLIIREKWAWSLPGVHTCGFVPNPRDA